MAIKKANFKKLLVMPLAVGIFLSSCDKDNNSQLNLSGLATGDQEVPPVVTRAAGGVTGTYDEKTHTLTYKVTWDALTSPAVGAHFHGPADRGQVAKVLIPINISNEASGLATGSVILADSVANFFKSGKMYYNVHSAQYPNGEIRAQVTMR